MLGYIDFIAYKQSVFFQVASIYYKPDDSHESHIPNYHDRFCTYLSSIDEETLLQQELARLQRQYRTMENERKAVRLIYCNSLIAAKNSPLCSL